MWKLANPRLYCDRKLWEEAPAPQRRPASPTDPILELFGADAPEEAYPMEMSTPSPNLPAHPKRATPRLKGVARREHAISQAGMAEKLAGVELSPIAIGAAREKLSSNYMERSKTRTAHTADAVGESDTCPECGREFCIIWGHRDI